MRASIEKGVPAIAWQPMTVEQRRDGAAAYEWQLLVGCDPRERTYTVRFGRDDEHRVGYDRFGYTGQHSPPDTFPWSDSYGFFGERALAGADVSRTDGRISHPPHGHSPLVGLPISP